MAWARIHLVPLVERELATPLGLDGCYVGAPEDQLHRAATLIWPERGRLLQSMSGGNAFRWIGDAGRNITGPLRTISRSMGVDFDLGSLVDAMAPHGISDFDFGAHETLTKRQNSRRLTRISTRHCAGKS